VKIDNNREISKQLEEINKKKRFEKVMLVTGNKYLEIRLSLYNHFICRYLFVRYKCCEARKYQKERKGGKGLVVEGSLMNATYILVMRGRKKKKKQDKV